MRLKKIKIHGFKSFADKVSLDFHDGITGIVGPNGCGKSNILDAFRWVLGETSARSLRGKKMEDIIFAGTDSRKPLNFAEVSLSFTQADTFLSTEFHEIEITRRCHRNGETEYFINKTQVRMKDIVNLFLDTGIGKSAFSIFEQGKIDQVIQYTPLERRAIFEEAAGILRFLERRKEAFRKLEGLDQNLLRAGDIHKEIERNIDHLEKQVAIALSFQEKKKKLQELEIGFLVCKRNKSHQKLEKLNLEESKLKKSYESFELEQKKLDEAILNQKEGLETLSREFQRSNEKVYLVRSEKEIRSREKKSNEERLKETKTKLSEWKLKLENMQILQEERKSQEAKLKKQIQISQASVDEQTQKLNQKRNLLKAAEESLEKLREKQHRANQESLKELQLEKTIEADVKGYTIKEENLASRLSEIEKRNAELDRTLSALLEKRTVFQGSLKALVDDVEIKKELFLDLEERGREKAAEISTSDEEHKKCERTLIEIEARLKSLQKLKSEYVGFSSGAKRLLEETKNPKSALFNKISSLFEHFQIKKEKLKALHHFLKPYQSVLVVQKEHAKGFFDWVEKEKLSEFSLLIVDNARQVAKFEIGSAEKVLEEAEMGFFEKIFLNNIFSFEKKETGVSFIESHEGAQAIIKDELSIDQKQVMFFGQATEGNPILREAELKELEVKKGELEEKKEQLLINLRNLEEVRKEIHLQKVELDKVIRKLEMRVVEENFFLQNVLSDLANGNKEKVLLTEEGELAKKELQAFKEKMIGLKKAFHEASQKRLLLEANLKSCHEELQSFEIEAKNIRSEVQEMTALLEEGVSHLRKTIHETELIKAKEEASEKEKQLLFEEMALNEEWLHKFNTKSSDFETILESVETDLKSSLDECHKLGETVEIKKKEIKENEEKLKAIFEKSKQIEQEASKIAISKAGAETDIKSFENELISRFQLDEEALQKQFEMGDSFDVDEKTIKQLRAEIESESGSVNMSSIDECGKQKERALFFSTQLNDLTASKQELLAIIAELDGKSRELFKETFERIRENFRKNFQILFVGGEADLELIDSEDILQAGIEISAKPPGKKMRSINLLSGGEKCLTAMALLFSLFEVKPSPFCILDEIDAPLDDTNVERFLSVVEQFTDRSQFIIITHNKRTMAICNRIFGVSMEEKGVSKLLSIEFSKERMDSRLVEA